MHSARRAAGQDQPRLLYWFRTPPHVKVGRAAFDEDAIRELEAAHPQVEFDWTRILATRAPAAPEPRDPRERPRRPERRPGREPRREDVRPPRAPERPSRPLPPAGVPEAEAPPWVPPVTTESAEPPPPIRALLPMPETTASPLPPADQQPEPVIEAAPAAGGRRFVRVFDAPAETPRTHHAIDVSVAERVLGAEQLTVLRARYAEICARITARGGDPARVDAFREQAERVNPDAWVTEAEVRAGLAGLDAVLAELHQAVGRRRRRRRKRRTAEPGQAGEAPAVLADGEEPPDEGDLDDGDDEEDGESS
jgi:hypothetical protein